MTTINRPTKPSSTLPTTWGGTKTAYTESQISAGYSETIPTVIDGGNINYEKQGTFERLEYLTKIADVIRDMPSNMLLIVNGEGKFEYAPYTIYDMETLANEDLSNLSTTGEARFNAKANEAEVLHKAGAEEATGHKTFSGGVTASSGTFNGVTVTGTGTFNQLTTTGAATFASLTTSGLGTFGSLGVTGTFTAYDISEFHKQVSVTYDGASIWLNSTTNAPFINFHIPNVKLVNLGLNGTTKNLMVMNGGSEYDLIEFATPDTNSNGNHGATTAWVNNKKADITTWGIPNYKAGIAVSTGFAAPSNGYVIIVRGTGVAWVSLYVNGVEVASNRSNTSNEGGSLTAFVKKGDVITFGDLNNVQYADFYPCIGG